MEYVQMSIGFLQAHPVVALAIGILILLMFLYKHPKVFFVLAVVAVVLYLVFSLAEVGSKQKGSMIRKSAGPDNATHVLPAGM